ncbi:very-long-chain enoyl-CoA reductase-like isoform X1 [Arapaima gigas]
MSRVTFFEVEVLDHKTKAQLCFLDKVEPHATIAEIKCLLHKCYPKWYPARQALKLDPSKSLEDILFRKGTVKKYVHFFSFSFCLFPGQVFLAEYMGPLFIYLLFYFRLPYIYNPKYTFTSSPYPVVPLACLCHSLHYIKRLIETIFVHRFSHSTMPLRSMMKNCLYYWGFAAWLAYYINHPLYTPPTYGNQQIHYALILFLLCEAGNFSINLALNNIKSDGDRSGRIPYPTRNPFTWLFFFVSCPNYTYQVGTWIGFTIMTQCVPVALFTLVGFVQMTIWARGRHNMYLRQFKDYPSLRMAIIPLFL